MKVTVNEPGLPQFLFFLRWYMYLALSPVPFQIKRLFPPVSTQMKKFKTLTDDEINLVSPVSLKIVQRKVG